MTGIFNEAWQKVIAYNNRPTARQMIKKKPILLLYAVYHWCVWSKYHMTYEMKG